MKQNGHKVINNLSQLTSDPKNARSIVCSLCGISVIGRIRPERKYCSRRCAGIAGRPARVTRTCEECQNSFIAPASYGSSGRYCGRSCQMKALWRSRPREIPPEEKACSKCATVYPCTTDWFAPTKEGRGGLKPECRDCVRDRATEWRSNRVLTEEQIESHRMRARLHAQFRRVKLRAGGHGIRHGVANVRRLWQEQGGCCAYCKELLTIYHIDHVIPIARGGEHVPTNWCLSCPSCNFRKHARTPEEWAADGYARRRAS